MKSLRRYISTLTFLACGLSLQAAAPSVVSLDTGEQLIGEVLSKSTEKTLFLKSELLGELQLPRERVISIQAKANLAQSKSSPPAEKSKKPTAKPVSKPKLQTAEAERPAQNTEEPPSEIAESELSLKKQKATLEREIAKLQELKVVERFKSLKTPDDWSGNMRLGVNFSEGDTRWAQTYANIKLEIDPKRSANFYRFTGSYTYCQTENASGYEYKSTDKYSAEFVYRRTFWEKCFVQNALGYRADHIKGIDLEAQDTVGIGYRYKPSDKFDVLFGGGGGVEKLDANYEDTRSGLNPVLNVFQEATWKPLKRTSLVQKFNYYWNPEDSNQFNYVFTAALRLRLTDLLGLEFSYSKSFDNDVGDGSEQDDVQWRNALIIYF
jgi:putative salt-induced outer membrane protein YdiY